MRVELSLVCIAVVLALPVGAAEIIIDPSQVGRGDQGRCVTEMGGGERLEIPVTVLGVLDATEPEGEIVLVRLDHPRLEHTGIIAGMSGSPVYIEGMLLGAVAFGWPFSKEPIAGVTPFTYMQHLSEEPGRQSEQSLTGSGRPTLAAIVQASNEGQLGPKLLDWLVPMQATGLRPLPVSLAVSAGPRGTGLEWLDQAWRRLGWVSSAAAGKIRPGTGGERADRPERGARAGALSHRGAQAGLRPGDMVAGVIVDGDAIMAVGGTVTEVRGDEVWALGHPFLGAGTIELPMARARVVAVLPSEQASFKFFAVGEQIGAFRADRNRGMWGVVGPDLPMVPVEVVTDTGAYSFRCLRHPVLLPLMASFLIDSSYSARGRTFGDQTVRLVAELGYADELAVTVEETFAGADAGARAASLASAVAAYLEGSSFEAAELESMQFRVEAQEALATAEIIDAVPDRYSVRPGSELSVRVRLRPHRGEVIEHRSAIRVPEYPARSSLDLVVAAGGSWSVYDLQMRPGRPGSFKEEVDQVRRLRPASQLVLAFEEPGTGVTLPGGSVSAPAGVVLALRSGLGSNLRTISYRVVEIVEQEMPYPIVGAFRIPLKIDHDGFRDDHQAAYLEGHRREHRGETVGAAPEGEGR